MKLRRPCEHGQYDAHDWVLGQPRTDSPCLGGVFLPDDTLIVEKVDIDRHVLVAALDEWGVTFAGNEDQMVISAKTRGVLRAAAQLVLNAISAREAE